MEMQKRTLFRFILFFTCLMLSITVSAAKPDAPPGDGPGTGFTHEKYFTKHLYEGTASCNKCHMDEAQDVLTTGHWKWQGLAENVAGVEGEIHGKNDFLNNFCVAVPSNEGRCAQCHIGYGYTDKDFDFTNAENIDCLICHDQTGTYKKGATTGGLPDLGDPPVVDLNAVARSVADNSGVPGRQNCIVCHAKAGGGDNVKHGDLALSLAATTRDYDVHMGTDGADMTCVDCHDVDRDLDGQVTSHGIGGMPFHSIDEGSMKQCTDCHENSPPLHKGKIKKMLKTHDRLACQVCHIPAIARQTSTKVEWYWSYAGEDVDPIPVDPITGRPTYDKKKGTFVWALNVRPTLRFHNGKWNKMMVNVNDVFVKQPVDLGSPAADYTDPDAMIYPFKKMIGNQVADAKYDTVLVPHLFKWFEDMPNPYWGFYDWDGALLDGAWYTGQVYSDTFQFIDTEMLLSVNHEIAPKEQSLGAGNNCNDCHGDEQIDWPALGWGEDPYKEKQKGKKN